MLNYIRCNAIDCINHTKDRYCSLNVVEHESVKENNMKEYVICKNYEQGKNEENE